MFEKIKKLAGSSFKLFTLRELKALFKLRKRFGLKKLRPAMVGLTYIGSAGAVWTLPALYLLRKKKNRFDGLLVLTGITGDVLFNNVVTKIFFHRKRPWEHFSDMFSINALAYGYSFPSGHALTNTTAATIFILINKNNAVWAVPLAGMISFSRLYLFAHYPSDVITGMINGILVGVVVYEGGYKLMQEGKLKWLERIIDDEYIFSLKNIVFHPFKVLQSIKQHLFE